MCMAYVLPIIGTMLIARGLNTAWHYSKGRAHRHDLKVLSVQMKDVLIEFSYD